jgi:hypothetical protein
VPTHFLAAAILAAQIATNQIWLVIVAVETKIHWSAEIIVTRVGVVVIVSVHYLLLFGLGFIGA